MKDTKRVVFGYNDRRSLIHGGGEPVVILYAVGGITVSPHRMGCVPVQYLDGYFCFSRLCRDISQVEGVLST